MVDIGVNLANKAFAADRADVIERAFSVGVSRMVVTGTSLASSRAALQLAGSFSGSLFSTAGVHPHDAKDFSDETSRELAALTQATQVVAIGECGLDFNRDFSPRDDQRSAFRTQVELAIDLEMPLFVHERDAAGDLLAILDSFAKLPPLVVHCFTGSGEVLAQYIQRDFHIGITGWICDERRGHHLLDLVPSIPTNRLMIETDAPYLLPRTIEPRPKSRRNEPAFLVHVANAVATARGCTVEQIAEETTRVATSFFGLT